MGPAQRTDSVYGHLNSSGEAEMSKVRKLLNEWFANYPEAEQARLAGSLRSKRDQHFLAAFWELYLHQSLYVADFSVECHPNIPGASTTPDFRVSRDGEAFYLEARAVSPSAEDSGAKRRAGALYDALDGVDTSNFLLSVTLIKQSSSAAPGKRFRNRINAWLAGHNPDDYLGKGHSEWPAAPFADQGWAVAVTACPLQPNERGKRRRAVRISGDLEWTQVTSASAIRNGIYKKAGYYDCLDGPLVIALLVRDSPFAKQRHVGEALYGTECVDISFDRTAVRSVRASRRDDGTLTTPDERSSKSLAGVVAAVGLNPFNISRRAPSFLPNLLVGEFGVELPWTTWRPSDRGEFEELGQFSPSAFWGLSTSWPE